MSQFSTLPLIDTLTHKPSVIAYQVSGNYSEGRRTREGWVGSPPDTGGARSTTL